MTEKLYIFRVPGGGEPYCDATWHTNEMVVWNECAYKASIFTYDEMEIEKHRVYEADWKIWDIWEVSKAAYALIGKFEKPTLELEKEQILARLAVIEYRLKIYEDQSE